MIAIITRAGRTYQRWESSFDPAAIIFADRDPLRAVHLRRSHLQLDCSHAVTTWKPASVVECACANFGADNRGLLAKQGTVFGVSRSSVVSANFRRSDSPGIRHRNLNRSSPPRVGSTQPPCRGALRLLR